jgi:hypothetical protein
MAESLEPPAPVSQEELAKIKDAATRENVAKANEMAEIAFTKAVEARKHAKEVARQAGLKSREERARETIV